MRCRPSVPVMELTIVASFLPLILSLDLIASVAEQALIHGRELSRAFALAKQECSHPEWRGWSWTTIDAAPLGTGEEREELSALFAGHPDSFHGPASWQRIFRASRRSSLWSSTFDQKHAASPGGPQEQSIASKSRRFGGPSAF